MTFKKIWSVDKEKLIITLMKYIQIIITNMKKQSMKQRVCAVDISMNTPEAFQIGYLYKVVVKISEGQQ